MPDERPRGVVLVVARRELADHVRSVRFLTLCVLALLLLPLSIYTNAEQAARRGARADALRVEQRRAMAAPVSESGVYESRFGWRGGRVIADPALRAIRAPTAFGMIVSGSGAPLPVFWQFATEGVEPGPADEATGPGLDAVFVVQMVLGLLALLLVFDAVSGERESGVLRLLLSMPVRRADLVLGKALGALATLALPLALGLGAALLVLERSGRAPLAGDGPLRLALFVGAAGLYLAQMVALGLAVSAGTRRARTSWVVLLLTWIAVVLVMPRAAETLATALRPVPTPFETRQAIEEAMRQLEAERARAMQEAWRQLTGSDSVPEGYPTPEQRAAYTRATASLEASFVRRKRLTIAAIRGAESRARERQRALAHAVARLSPAAAFASIAGRLAEADDEARARWEEQAAEHQARLERATFDRRFGLQLYPRSLGWLPITWWPDLRDPTDRPPDYRELPSFAYRAEPVAALARRSLPDVALLVGGTIVAMVAALIAFVRLDLQ